ncbi:MAG: UDP-N-acetylmuramate--L-alanine ligase, partial [Thermomicrobiales bacterium]
RGERLMIPSLPPLPARVHFVGIGGIGMSGLARILHTWGYTVSGSDGAASPLLDELASEGIAVRVGHTMLDEAAAADLVVMTAAVKPDNPEVAAAAAAGKPVMKRAALLGALMNERDGLAVAGSHGKSTTSGMLGTALIELGKAPSYAVGATLAATGTNAAPGAGPHFVVEADEYDYSFLQLAPLVAAITNIEYDHPDIYPDTEAYDASFARFVAGIRREGALIVPADDPGIQRLLARSDVAPPAHLVTFGETAGADWLLSGSDGAWTVSVPDGRNIPLTLAVPGKHNARNATAAMAMMGQIGIDPAHAARALSTFDGVGRRFERKGEEGGVLVIDDYAHHPTEIRATLRAARERFPDRRVWGIFQPHTYSRLKALMADFGAAFDDADKVGILDVYASRETDTLGVSADDLRALLPADALNASTPADAAEKLAAIVQPGDVVFTLGAGSITDLGPLLLDRLKASSTPAPGRPPRRQAESLPIPGTALKAMKDSPLRLWTTWHVGGNADLLVRAGTPEDIAAAARWGIAQGLPVTVIGGGSNLLVGDGGIRGLVILARTPGDRAEHLLATEDLGDRVRLTVGANAPLSWTGRYAAEHGWSGLDWAVGLPGTVGGATVNNAGAHGTEMQHHLESVDLLDLETGDILNVGREWLDPAYRHTTIKAAARPRRWVVLRTTMVLPKGDAADLVRLADEHADFRKRTQPGGATGGSTFANPPGDYAGRLLEAAGMKGFRVGGASFSEKHANWIVNDGNATAADIRNLIRTARERVKVQFGVDLRQEVEELGEQ